jgi:hypothetical protein
MRPEGARQMEDSKHAAIVELRELLKKAGIEFDERYLWD